MRRRRAYTDHATHRDTPPERRSSIEAGLLARGSSPLPGLPDANASDRLRQKLAAHSCGGSSGVTPAGSPDSLLAPDRNDRGNLER
jgi:hypothetical protein